MASTTLANQDSTISIKQKLSISIEVELETTIEGGAALSTAQLEALVNSSNANLDISSIILQVLGGFNNARLGSTEVSGGLVADSIDVDEIFFSSDETIIDINDIRLDISNLKTSVSYFSSVITEISTNLLLLDNSTVKLDIFNDLSSSHYSLYNRVNDLSINFSNLENKINDISFIFDNFELSNNRILVKLSMDISNLLITSNDFSFSYLETLDNSDNFVLSLKQLNELLGTYNFVTTQELSSITVDISSSFEYVNEINQTFYEIMTQQPYKFRKSTTNPIQISTSEIIINWTFDHLIADHSNNSVYKAQLANGDNIKLAQLPFIDRIQIDISGKFEDGTQSEWLELSTLSIPSDICYNTSNYKTSTIVKPGNANYTVNDVNNLLNNNNYFNLRVYGINNAINYPSIEERGLIYEFLRFDIARPPSAPTTFSDVASNSRIIIITFYVTNTEKDISNSNAKIKTLDISYSLNESLRSSYLTFNPSDYNPQNKGKDYTNNLINQNVQFSDSIIDLFPGSNYNYQARVKNNLNDLSFSEYGTISLSNYTDLPNNSGTNINFLVHDSIKRHITNSDFDNNEVIYINLSDSNNKIQFQNTDLQNFEVTNPSASTNGINMKGYGKFLDIMSSNSALVTINVYVDDISKQTIIYDNSFTRINAINNYSHSYFVNTEFKIEDMYDNINKGFRLKGSLNLNHISDSASIIDKIGLPSASPYKLTFKYLRDPNVNGVNSTIDHYIYIDDFSGIPVINTIDNSNVVTQLAYNMGIPSVQTFNLKMQRNYNAINSQYKYFLSNKKISKLNPISNTSASQEQLISLNSGAEIKNNGSYYYNYNNFDSATNNYYNNLNYTTSLLTNNYNLSWNEIVYNLYSNYRISGNNFDISHITNHFCDYNSFITSSNNKINNSKLDLTLINVYEIDNINELGNNIDNLTISHYTNHNNLVKDSTLLYIDGKFKSNSTSIYPDVNTFNYNSLTITNNYSLGNISYDLNGNNTGINNDGYKFIVFKINKSSSQDYTFNNIEYSRINYDSKTYISIKSMLTGLFDINTINKIFNINDNDAIGFVKVTLKETNAVRVGNLKKEFIPVGGDWTQYSTTPVSYNNTFLKAYGSQVENTSNGDFGIFINPTAVNDDLTLFIGLKNN